MTTERKMTIKRFIHAASTSKVSPITLIAANQEFLSSDELSDITGPILARIQNGDVLPTPGMNELCQALFAYSLVQKVKQAEKDLEKESNPGKGRATTKAYSATVYNEKHEVCQRINEKGNAVNITANFDLSSEADSWADRRLIEGASDWYAVIVSNTMTGKDGLPLSLTITRDDAFARIYKQGRSAVCKGPAKSSSLKWVGKAKQDHAKFSRG
jgi:hypothetical protein